MLPVTCQSVHPYFLLLLTQTSAPSRFPSLSLTDSLISFSSTLSPVSIWEEVVYYSFRSCCWSPARCHRSPSYFTTSFSSIQMSFSFITLPGMTPFLFTISSTSLRFPPYLLPVHSVLEVFLSFVHYCGHRNKFTTGDKKLQILESSFLFSCYLFYNAHLNKRQC